jgi:magnesium transporter
MNFQAMPELGWQLGYPLALVLMMMVSISLHVVFKHRSWI